MTLNPIAVVLDVIAEYKQHLRTEFRARDSKLRGALEAELDRAGFLAQEPFFQAHRPFKAGKPWRELGLDARLAGVMEQRSTSKTAYLHQSQAIDHLLAPDASPLVVTTGTGSGKSECFLLPVIQNAIDDALRFKESGLTAILVYPMNALANDQQARIEDYLEASGHTYVSVARYDRSTKQDERERLRQNPPHILLTNYVMLEYLLVRPSDREDIFANQRCRFLVLDEVHTYRGSLGANIALLVRRVRGHLDHARQDWGTNVEPKEKRFPTLVHVATSATIKSVDETGKTAEEVASLRDEAVQGFFSTLAGVNPKTIAVIGESLRHLEVPSEAQWPVSPIASAAVSLADAKEVRDAVAQLAGLPPGTAVEKAARHAAILYKLNDLLARRPLSIEQMVALVREQVPARSDAEHDEVQREVEAALVIGAALPDGTPGALRLRTHRFVRGGWKFFRCVDPNCGRLYPKGEERCACGKPTAQLCLCRACGIDVLRFKGNEDPTTAPLESTDSRSNEDEWVLYDRERIEAAADAEDLELDTDRKMKKRPVVEGSFDPATLQVSLDPSDYPVRCVLAPARTTCLVCGGTAGSKDVLTPVALGTSAAVRVVAEGVLEGLAREHKRHAKGHDGKERLLIFSDSRQDAAHQARFITYAGRYDRMRRRIVEALETAGKPLIIEDAVRRLLSLGVQHHDNPHTAKYDSDKYLSEHIRKQALAWEEAPLLDDISITSGYRATLPNLGLLGVRYEHLDEYVNDKGATLASELGVSQGQLVFLARCVLDEMRRRGALSRPILAYHPASPDCPDEFRGPADWERRLRWPTGYAYDASTGRALANLERAELPEGIALQGFWRRAKAGGRGPQLERRFKKLLGELGGAHGSEELLMRLVSFLMEGPRLIIPVKLHGVRKVRELLQVNAQVVQLELLAEADRFRCNVCNVRMPWVEQGTPCPGCEQGVLVPWPDAEIRESRYVQRIASHELIPLIAGEHTAQVTGDDRIELENKFKAGANASALNVLSCSPTLEMGIDVGGLDAVVLRNIPPRPDNYAQRGGRAGRRTRVGIVLGYARNTPHDGYFYDKPAEMIAGEVPAPGVGLGNRDVTLRHLHAIVFGAAEPGLGGRMEEYISLNGELKQAPIDSLVGALEAKFEHATELAMTAWGNDVRVPAGLTTEQDVREALARLPAAVRVVFDRVALQIRQLEAAIQTGLAGLKQRPVVNAMELKRRLLGVRDDSGDADDRTSGHPMRRFAEFGVLPGYEFPAEPCTVRLLGDRAEDEPITVERRFGLGQYQPEAKAHARGHRWRITGLDLASPWNPKSAEPNWVYSICRECELRYGTQEHPRCPRCKADKTIASGLPGYAYGGFVAVRDDTPVLEEEDRFATAALVQAHPQHDGHPMYRYDLPTAWFAELRKGETVRWVNEWREASKLQKDTGAPQLHDGARGFYLCPDCGRSLEWPTETTAKKQKGSKKAAKEQDESFGHSSTCPRRGQPPVPCAIVATSSATTFRIFVELPSEWRENEDRYYRWGYSLGYALRTGIRQLYMLDGPEIEFSLEPMWEQREAQQTRLRGALTFLDPAVGGSGFLERAALELHLVAARALDHLDHKDCESACYRCLKAYTNQRFHQHLDWLSVVPDLEQLGVAPPEEVAKEDYDPRPWLEAYDAGVGSPLELRFLRLFEKHGIAVEKQVPVAAEDGGAPISIADFVVKGTRTAVYVDGAAFHQGERLRRDRRIRARLRTGDLAWQVVELTSKDLKNDAAVLALLRQ
jgi:hypothetical protein